MPPEPTYSVARERFSMTTWLISLPLVVAGGLGGIGVIIVSLTVMPSAPVFGVAIASVGVVGVVGALSLLALLLKGRPADPRRMAVALAGIAMPIVGLALVRYSAIRSPVDETIREGMRSDLRNAVEAQVAFREREGRFADTIEDLGIDRQVLPGIDLTLERVDSLGFRILARSDRTGIQCAIEYHRERHDARSNMPDTICWRGAR